jgi:hypothetical protein
VGLDRPRGGGHAFPGWGTAIETQLATIPTLTRLSTPRGRPCARRGRWVLGAARPPSGSGLYFVFWCFSAFAGRRSYSCAVSSNDAWARGRCAIPSAILRISAARLRQRSGSCRGVGHYGCTLQEDRRRATVVTGTARRPGKEKEPSPPCRRSA